MKWGFVAALALVAVVDACTTTTHARDAPVVPAPMAAGTSAIVSDGKTTFTVRIEQRSTVISAPGRSELVIPARYALPVISAVGTLGGLAQDGRTLPLAPAAHTPTSRFALVDTRLDRAPTFVELPGQFSFDALSQTGTMLYPVQHLQATNSGRYSVRVYDVALRGSGRCARSRSQTSRTSSRSRRATRWPGRQAAAAPGCSPSTAAPSIPSSTR
jgi:hypothetical protein